MELLLKRIAKVALFFLAFYALSKALITLMRSKGREMGIWDPEIFFLAGIGAALVTMAFSKLLLPLV